MSKKRLKPGGTSYHHVTTRTAQGVFWLEEDEVKKIFKELVADYTEIYFVVALAQSCMSNHTLCEASHKVCWTKPLRGGRRKERLP